MAARAAQQSQSVAPAIAAVGVLGVLAGAWLGYPGFVALLVAAVTAAFMEPAPVLTGPKKAGGPTPAGPGEEAKLERYRAFQALQLKVLPGMAWLPNDDIKKLGEVQAAWLGGLALAALAALAPSQQLTWRGVNAVAAFAVVVGVAAARRSASGSPGSTLPHLVAMVTDGSGTAKVVVHAVFGGAFGAGIGYVTYTVLAGGPAGPPLNLAGWVAAVAVTCAGVAVASPWRQVALAAFRDLVEQRAVWAPRWETLKLDPAPRMLSTQMVGDLRVSLFDAGPRGSAAMFPLTAKIAPMVPAGNVAVMPSPADGPMGPIPGTSHMTQFEVATWDDGTWPDVGDPAVPSDVVTMCTRIVWAPRWETLKLDPAPRMLSTQMVGDLRVSLFDAGPRGSAAMFPLTAKIAPMVPAGNVAVMPSPADGPMGPIPGTSHMTQFEVATWDDGTWPDVGDPTVPFDVVTMCTRIAFAAAPVGSGGAPCIPGDIVPLAVEGSPRAAYRAAVASSPGTGAWSIRIGSGARYLSGPFLGDVMFDHRAAGGAGALYFGDFDNADLPDEHSTALFRGFKEDEWNDIWKAVLKTGVNPPVIQWVEPSRASLSGGQEIETQVFAPRTGEDIREVFTPQIDRKLKGSMGGPAFMTVTAFTQQGASGRVGERHAQAFRVIFSRSSGLPASPEKLAPSPGQGPQWMMSGWFNTAFDQIRQARPEVVSVRCLTGAPDPRRGGSPVPRRPGRSAGHIWEVRLRLYDGVAFADVRTMAERLRQAMGVTWLRVTEAEDGCTIFLGASPSTVTLANPTRDSQRLTSMDWDQAFVDSKVTGVAGRVPSLTKADRMPRNDKVEVLDFDMPPGLDIGRIREAISKLRTATGNGFIQVLPGVGGASTVRILTSPIDPMPFPAMFDYEVAKTAKRHQAFFGTGVDGEPVCLDLYEMPHSLIAGTTGSGKSIFVQAVLASLAIKPASDVEFYVVDIQKKGADFRFLSPFVRGEAYEAREAAALMRAIYAEGEKRLAENARLGVGHVKEWDVPPPHIIVVIDEFTSLITTETVSRTGFDDPELEAGRQAVLADNAHRTTIGQFAGKFARVLRSAGVTMLLATQQLKQDSLKTIPGGDTLKSQLSRILLGKASLGEKQAALKEPFEAADLGEVVPKGRGLFESSAHNGLPIQGWYEPSLERYVEEISAVRALVTEAERLDFTPFLVAEVDQGPAIVAIDLDDISPAATVADVDLGELELDMDLFVFDDGGDEGDSEPEGLTVQPEPDVAPDLPVIMDEPVPGPVDLWADAASAWGGEPEQVGAAAEPEPVAEPDEPSAVDPWEDTEISWAEIEDAEPALPSPPKMAFDADIF